MILTEAEKVEITAHRKRYEELKTVGQGEAPRALPPATSRDDAPIVENAIVHREIVPAGWYWTMKLDRGETLRLLNQSGKSCGALTAWNRADPSERLNHADTVKVQWAAALRKGRVILSDMGRVVFSITEDTSGAHDAITGVSNARTVLDRYGEGFRNTRDNLALAAGKIGLDRADIASVVNFFAPVSVSEDGTFRWDENKRSAGDFVDLRAELDLWVAISNCPHPMDPAKIYAPGDLVAIRYRSKPPMADDLCRTASAEAKRAFENNALYLEGTAQ
jgi:uncharacterized protein